MRRNPSRAVEPLEARRLFAYGDVDGSFAFVNSPEFATSDGVAVMANGNVVHASHEPGQNGVSQDATFSVYTPSGTLDRDFGRRGRVTGVADDVQFLRTTDRRILAFGPGRVVALTYAGAPDTTFGTDGVATLPAAYVDALATGNGRVTVAPDGSFYVYAASQITRFTAAGQVDPSFGPGGVFKLSTAPTAAGQQGTVQEIGNVAVRPDGDLLVAGLMRRGSTVTGKNGEVAFVTGSTQAFVFRVAKPTTGGGTWQLGGAFTYDTAGPTYVSAGSVRVLSRADGSALLAFNNGSRLTTIHLPVSGKPLVLADAGKRPSGQVNELYPQPDGTVLVVEIGGTGLDRSSYFQTLTLTATGWQAKPAVAAYGQVTATAPDARGRVVFEASTGLGDGGPSYAFGRLDTGPATGSPFGQYADGTVNALDVYRTAFDPTNRDSVPVGLVGMAYFDARVQRIRYAQSGGPDAYSDVALVDPARLPRGTHLAVDLNFAHDAYDSPVPQVVYENATGGLNVAQGQTYTDWTTAPLVRRGVTPSVVTQVGPGGGRTEYVAFYDPKARDLKVARRGAAPIVTTVDSAGDTGRTPSIAINPASGLPAIAYAGPGGTVRLAEMNRRGKWSLSQVGTTRDGVGAISLAFDLPSASRVAAAAVVAFTDEAAADLLVARRPGNATRFSTVRLASAGKTGYYPTVARGVGTDGKQDAVQAFWFDRSAGRVRSGLDVTLDSRGRPVGGPSVNQAALGPGGQYLSAVYRVGTGKATVAYVDDAGTLVLRDV